ncbi:MAG TPA: hypothetical protein VGR67_04440 [Candidatus Polarisedimenticolia bacterium]|nr:hypothetical protein [Candidatus Polarisedimenticolia bacterium]
MKRPLGVSAIALLVVGFSALMLYRAASRPRLRLEDKFLLASAALCFLGLIAAEALWSLRGRAFLAFSLWSMGAVACMVMSRMPLASSGHGIRLMGPIAGAGLAYALAALYLRRAV